MAVIQAGEAGKPPRRAHRSKTKDPMFHERASEAADEVPKGVRRGPVRGKTFDPTFHQQPSEAADDVPKGVRRGPVRGKTFDPAFHKVHALGEHITK